MKKLSIFVAAVLAACLAYGKAFKDFSIEGGAIIAGNGTPGEVSLNLSIFDDSWNSSSIAWGDIRHLDGSPAFEQDIYQVRGKLLLPGKKSRAEVSQKLELLKSDASGSRYNLKYEIALPPEFKARQVAFSASSPIGLSFGGGLQIDGKAFKLPIKKEKASYEAAGAKSFSFFADNGILTIVPKSGNASLQDNRAWNMESFSVRIVLPVENGKCSAEFDVKLEKYRFAKIPLPSPKPAALQWLPKKPDFGKVKYFVDSPAQAQIVAPGESLELTLPPDSKYIYLLSTFSSDVSDTLAEAEIVKSDGTSVAQKLSKGDCDGRFAESPEAAVAWRAMQPDGKVHALYSSKIECGGGGKSLKLKNTGESDWILYAATASNANLAKHLREGNFTAPDENYFPIEFSPSVAKGSVLDFSFLLDAPAGKYGFARPSGESIVFEKRPEVPVKFFGNNMTMHANFPEKEIAPIVADTFARTGYNICRFHFYDKMLAIKNSDGATEINPRHMDKMDFFANELRKRGVYYTTDLYMAREIDPKTLEPEFHNLKISTLAERKSLFYLSQKARDNLKKYSANLLNHVNPYTKLAWKDDPALVSISLVNEDTIGSTVNGSTAPLFRKRFAEWLSANALSETPENEKLLFAKFLKELHSSFYKEMKDFLRSIGVRQMLTDENHMSSIPQSLGSEEFDVVDTHTYYGHPNFIFKSWQMPVKVRNDSSLGKLGADSVTKGTLTVAGKPLTLTEWNHVVNNDTAAEGAFIMGAYGSMQGLDMLCRYTYRHAPHDLKPTTLKYFDTDSNPVISLSERAAALFLLRGDVREADAVFPCVVSRDFLDYPSPMKNSLLTYLGGLYRKMSLIGAPKIVITDTPQNIKIKGAKFVMYADERWKNCQFGVPAFSTLADDAKTLGEVSRILGGGLVNAYEKVYSSTTGQIKMDGKKETLSVSTSASEAFVGPEGTEGGGKFAKFKPVKSWGAFLAAAVDGKPLRNSSRILVLHLSDIKNTAMRYASPKKEILWDMGELPLLARDASAEISFDAPLEGWKCYAVSANGERLCEIPIKRENSRAKISARTKYGKIPVFAYELKKISADKN